MNLFWVSHAEAELAVLRQGLRSGAPLFILYGAEGPTGGDRVTALVAEAVKTAGFHTVTIVTADHGLGVISHAP
ncbi:hypothetical protein [Kribbella sp. VKM Ac-2568]|uniref:hypothetical protein n=1 Tax=Kribbella sp. VKM Ac-2568 TaxID=2512219 RepID=UPI0010D39CE1|nr:hypothetical protein [Kribbella sp. VKM Ac-2568]TCM44278.1 hypothetical protein EV648_108149 [Kribbella sp. VKM Ac-2568]